MHMWLPGNHTFVDAAQYETPNALADYIKLILTNDTVYQYHTTNYDTRKVLSFLDQHCPPEDDYVCSLCHHAFPSLFQYNYTNCQLLQHCFLYTVYSMHYNQIYIQLQVPVRSAKDRPVCRLLKIIQAGSAARM